MLVRHSQTHTLPFLQSSPPEPFHNHDAHISSPTAVQLPPKRDRPTLPTKAFTIRPATIDDAPSVAHLGATVFSSTFGFSIPTGDLSTYLDEAYSVSAIENDIHHPHKHILVACSTTTNKILGFAQLTEHTSERCLADLPAASLVELQRLYVHGEFHGHGLGRALTSEIEALATRKGYQVMWLGVWEGNFYAQRVYEKMGFNRVGEHEFKMGRCIQTDWIMCKEL